MSTAPVASSEEGCTSDTVQRPERIVIAVLTFRRPAELNALLPMLVDQASDVRDARRTVEVLVVDNDRIASAEAVVSDARLNTASKGVRIRYAHESEPGISAARNRALDEAAADDVLIFIDDDEQPADQWLIQLLEARDRFSADVVQGPVESRFEVEPDQWLRACGFDFRRRLPTGTALDVAVTNNLLINLSAVRSAGIRFDPDLGSTGGEDTLFTRMLHRAGASMYWCAEAMVYDLVPAHRITRAWARKRALSTGNATAVVTLKLTNRAASRMILRLRLTAAGVARIGGGGVRTLLARIIRSQTAEGQATRTTLRGVGMTLGAWGYAYQEYAQQGPRRMIRLRSLAESAPRKSSRWEVDHAQ